MALSPSAPTSPLRRPMLRYVSSQLVAALNHPAPTVSLPSSPRGVDAAAASQRVPAASRATPFPKGRPGASRPGSGEQVVHAVPATATTAPRVVLRDDAAPVQEQDSSGKTHAAPAAAATVNEVIGGPAQGSGEKIDAGALVAASLAAVRRPKPPGPPVEGSGGGGGSIH